MSTPEHEADRTLTSQEASDAASEFGWRLILGTLRTGIRVASIEQALDVASWASTTAGQHANRHLWIDLRTERVVLTLQSLATGTITALDANLARAISSAISARGLHTEPDLGGAGARSDQVLEIAIDALDIPSIRPFWKAVLGYTDEAGRARPWDPLVDPLQQGPAVWFQQMDAPRPQRNRIHLDLSVPHDELPSRLGAALGAGGTLLSDEGAPSFWVLADAEGNEVCLTTWQGRDG